MRMTSLFPAPSCLRSGVLLALSLLLASLATARAADGTLFRSLNPNVADLNQYQWRNRPVVIFAPSEKDADYIRQIKMLEQSRAALAERDIIVLSDTAPAKNGHLRSQLQPHGFEVVLVGKDGGIKIREKAPVSSEALLSTIDRMPMRQNDQD
ncbi:DUF4174 domain-containing protein [Pantoea sp.]|uniref:DUF4174 domain-containing protein n=1 Tax=Pantoea sp. TaxID=69393 RepID=UPI0028A2A2FF|nr:DUF4174 domain-containing protein [Pantoea sp.]